jgi:ParB family transcriptional regulator, chromosome partitioning protein
MATDKSPGKANPRRLGRGLDALLGQKPVATERGGEMLSQPVSALRDIPVADIRPNHYQPRKEFDPDELKELQSSISAAGLLQPITVRQITGEPGFELVAGERRLRAVTALGWPTIPALVREYDDRATLTLALVENLQRSDLNPIEEAEGYARLSAEFGLTQNEIAELVGKDRSTVANLLRVLQLPSAVRRMLESGELTMGHARPLLALEDDAQILTLAKEAVELDLSVRSIEQRVRQDAPKPAKPKRGRPMKEDTRPAEVRQVEEMLRRRLQTDVSVTVKQKQKGEFRVQFYSYEDLNRLLELVGALEDE